VYADNDPIVLAAGQGADGRAPPTERELHPDAESEDTGKILQDAAGTWTQPAVAVCLQSCVLSSSKKGMTPGGRLRTLDGRHAVRIYLAVAHPANDVEQEVAPALRSEHGMGGTGRRRGDNRRSSVFGGCR